MTYAIAAFVLIMLAIVLAALRIAGQSDERMKDIFDNEKDKRN